MDMCTAILNKTVQTLTSDELMLFVISLCVMKLSCSKYTALLLTLMYEALI